MKNKKESYEPFESIPADISFLDRSIEWSSMYSHLLNAKKIKKSDDLSKYTNESLSDMMDELEGFEKVESLRKEFVITKEELDNL
jgi:hypothetical protein